MKQILQGISLSLCVMANVALAQRAVSTWAGAQSGGSSDGPRLSAKFRGPWGIAVASNGTLYVCDNGNHRIRMISTTGDVTTLAGSGSAGFLDGAWDVAQFNSPTDLCLDDTGNVYVSDFNNHRIRKITPAGLVSTIAGSVDSGYQDGPALTARFDFPRGIARDRSGNLYVGDSWNHRIRKIDTNGIVSTYAGGGRHGFPSDGDYVDAADTTARFFTPCGLSADSAGNIFVADAYNHRIRKITPDRHVMTVAGSGATGQGNGGYVEGDTSIAILNTPTEVFAGSLGDVYFCDTFGNRIRRVLYRNVETLAGDGTAAYHNGLASTSAFSTPRGIVATHGGDSVFVCDFVNNSIRLVATTGSAVHEGMKNPLLRVYPNPTEGTLAFEDDGCGNCTFKIFGADGRDVTSFLGPHAPGATQFNLAPIPAGMYYLWSSGGAVARITKR